MVGLNMVDTSLLISDPFRYYCLYDYREITNYLDCNKIGFAMIMDSLRNKRNYIYVSIPVYERLGIASDNIISSIDVYYLNVIFTPANDEEILNNFNYKCIVKRDGENNILFSSESFRESFFYCHNLQIDSIDKAIKDILIFYINNGFDNLSEFEIIQLVLNGVSKAYNGNYIRKYTRYVFNKTFMYYKELKSLREREILLSSIKSESNILSSSKRRL